MATPSLDNPIDEAYMRLAVDTERCKAKGLTLGHGGRGPGRTPPSRWARQQSERSGAVCSQKHFSGDHGERYPISKKKDARLWQGEGVSRGKA
eukprot:4283480-Prymnesium_polylepis.1